MLKDAVQAEREQEADCARIENAVRLAETAIAAFASSDEARKRRCEIRDRTILTIADVRRNIVQRAKLAKETRKQIIKAFFRERTPGQNSDDYSAMLDDVPTSALVYHMQYLLRTGELDRVRIVYHVFENRLDRHRYTGAFDEIAAQCAIADPSDDLRKRLATICRLAEEVDTKLTNLWFRQFGPEIQDGVAHEPILESPGLGNDIDNKDEVVIVPVPGRRC